MAKSPRSAAACVSDVQKFETRLAVFAEKIAVELGRVPGKRNRPLVVSALGAMANLRPKLRKVGQELTASLSLESKSTDPSQQSRPCVSTSRRDKKRVLSGVKYSLRHWRAIVACVEAQTSGTKLALYLPPPPMHGLARMQTAISDAVFLLMHEFANPAPQHPSAKDHGCYADIRKNPSEFIGHAHAALRVLMAQRRDRPFRFLDVGCGGGGKVLLAARFFNEADGLEFDPSYAQSAHDLINATNRRSCRIIEGDALIYDEYRKYDVVYFYQPMDGSKLTLLEDRIVANVRPGTILIAPYSAFLSRSESLQCGLVAGCVYVAGTSAEEAGDLRDAAEFTGPSVSNGDDGPASGFWASIISASRANGFEPVG